MLQSKARKSVSASETETEMSYKGESGAKEEMAIVEIERKERKRWRDGEMMMKKTSKVIVSSDG
jgi:hypothetical protein